MDIRRRTTLQQWWEAGDTEESTVKRAAFKCWAVVKGVITSATGLGAAYHLYDWWRCKEENRKQLQDLNPHVGEPSDGLHVRASLSADAQASAPVLSLEQRVAAFRDLGEPQQVAYDHLLDLTRGGLDSATQRQLLQLGQTPGVIDDAVRLVLATLDAEHGEKLREAEKALNEAIFNMLSAEGWNDRHGDVKRVLSNWAVQLNKNPKDEFDLFAVVDELAPTWRSPEGAPQHKSFAKFLQGQDEDMKALIQQLNDTRAELENGHAADRQLVTIHAAVLKQYEEVL